MKGYYFHHFSHQVQNHTDLSGFWGAFAGAFFAFVFGLIAYRITKRWERFVQHKNALVKLERMLNHHYNELGILETIIADTISIVGQNKMTSNRLFTLKIPEGLDLELGSIDLINKLFTYQYYIDRYNINASTFNSALTRFEDITIAGHPLPQENRDYANKMLGGLQKELPSLGKVIKDLLVLTKIHIVKIKKEDFFMYVALHSQWDFKITETEINEESKKFDEETVKSSGL